MGPKRERPERELTDRSLAEERGKTDDELARRAARLEENADEVVGQARRRADDVLARARAAADERLTGAGAAPDARAAMVIERRVEDVALEHERAIADEKLVAERAERRGAIAALLAAERSQTDAHLRGERDRADGAIGSRDELLAVVGHDLRNMLAGIVLSCDLLVDIGGEGADQVSTRREAARIRHQAEIMARLVDDLLDLSSIEAGRLTIRPSRNAPTELLREAQDAFEPAARARGISVRTEVKAGARLADYDHQRILQVLANLLGNAIKFSPEGGRVDVLVEPVGGEIRFAVSDTGCGIAADQLDVVFERFRQGTTQARTGLGLGLYIARRIVQAHGGRIWAESRPGEGSTFYFTLPAASPASVTSPP